MGAWLADLFPRQVPSLRASITSSASSMLAVNNLNYVYPSSQHVADYLLNPGLQVRARCGSL